MRIFVTGASGWIGSAVVPELLKAGHDVVGLARSDHAAAKLKRWGAAVLRGDLDDVEILRSGASDSDGVIHLAFKHDLRSAPDGFARATASERQSIEAMGAVLVGTDRPLVIASGTPSVPGNVATENDQPGAEGPAAGRGANARAVIALAERGVRASVVRLPRSVHGEGDLHGFIPQLIAIAREKGASGFVGDGSSRWPAVHVMDAGHLFCLAIEKAPAGSVLHAVGDEGVPTREIAEVIGRTLALPTATAPASEFGFLGMVLAVDQPASSAHTRELLGWQPVRPGLIADMESGHYFASAPVTEGRPRVVR
jgi:nucleoside-diphosphate-sugar epimerase